MQFQCTVHTCVVISKQRKRKISSQNIDYLHRLRQSFLSWKQSFHFVELILDECPDQPSEFGSVSIDTPMVSAIRQPLSSIMRWPIPNLDN